MFKKKSSALLLAEQHDDGLLSGRVVRRASNELTMVISFPLPRSYHKYSLGKNDNVEMKKVR